MALSRTKAEPRSAQLIVCPLTDDAARGCTVHRAPFPGIQLSRVDDRSRPSASR